jgi:hypothetical protein
MIRYKSKFTIPTVKHVAGVMVWGCYSGKVDRGSLYILPKNKTMNGDRCKLVMEENLIPFNNITERRPSCRMAPPATGARQ